MADPMVQPLRMHHCTRPCAAGTLIRIVNRKQLAAALALEQRLLLHAGQPLDLGLAAHGLALRCKQFTVY